jgi:membrane protease YdiL (CAAX protease family)
MMGPGRLVRRLFYGPEKLRALWRILLFLSLTVLAGVALGNLAGAVMAALAERGLTRPTGDLWELGSSHAVVVAATLVASAVMMHAVERRPVAALGLPLGREAWLGWARGAGIGGAFVAALVGLAMLAGWVALGPDPGTFASWLARALGLAALFVVAAAAEELLFRGYAFQVLVEGLGVKLAVLLGAAVFALIHAGNPGVGLVAYLNIGLAGVLLATAYLRTRSLWVAIGLHWAWNWAQAVFDMPVSGIGFDVPGYDSLVRGPELLMGGGFGPEGGLVTTVLAVPLIAWVARTRRLTESPALAALRPLVDSRLRA